MYSKENQLNNTSKKKEPMFGKRPSRGNFLTKKQKPLLKSTKKIKKSDEVDKKFLEWKALNKSCVLTRKHPKRGVLAQSLHIHHIYGKNGNVNDYETVTLIGYVHSWGMDSYHSLAKSDFMEKWNLSENPKHFFLRFAIEDLEEYLSLQDCGEYKKSLKRVLKIMKDKK